MAEEVNWESLDKQKFLVWGAGLFSVRTRLSYIDPNLGSIDSAPILPPFAAARPHTAWFKMGTPGLQGLTTVLFPLTVIKTRQQALEGAPSGLRGAANIARDVVRTDGVRGLYRGFGTVIIGIIPARGVSSLMPRSHQCSLVALEKEHVCQQDRTLVCLLPPRDV